MTASESEPDWDPISGSRTWDDVKDHQFTGLSGLFGAAATSPDDVPPLPVLRDLIATALIARIKQSVTLPATPGMIGQPFAATEYDLADAVVAAVSAQQLYPTVRIYESAVTELRQQRERADAVEQALTRVKALAADMRTWCSPHGIASDYADRIEEAIAGDDPLAGFEFTEPRNNGWFWECTTCKAGSGKFSAKSQASKAARTEHPQCPPDPNGPWVWTIPLGSRPACTASCPNSFTGNTEHCALDADHDHPDVHIGELDANGARLGWTDSDPNAKPHTPA